MSRFLTSFSELLKEECRTIMLHRDMNLTRLIEYDKSIKESKLRRMTKNFNKSEPNQDFSNCPKANHEGGGGSQAYKSIFSYCGKKHFGM